MREAEIIRRTAETDIRLRLKLDGHPWTDVAMQLGKGTSSVYKQPKKLTEALHDALDKLWYLDI